MNILIDVCEQSLILFPLVIGIYLSYRILKITDLTVDGTYVLGAAMFAKTIHFGVISAMLLSIFSGWIMGIIVALMQRHDKINDLIAGILASFMLYSINLNLMGRPNISLLNQANLLTFLQIQDWKVLLLFIFFTLIIIIYFLLTSNIGLILRAFGHNRNLLQLLGKSPELSRMLGLGISNSLAALSGALSAQINGFVDINMGFGIALIAIGAVIIGQSLLRTNNFNALKEILYCFLGIALYFLTLNVLLRFGIPPANLKLLLGLFLFIALSKMRQGIE